MDLPETLDWSAFGATGSQAADFTGVVHTGTNGYMEVTATLLTGWDYNNDSNVNSATVGTDHIQGAFDASRNHTGEVSGGSMWAGAVVGGGIDLNNRLATNTGAGSSPAGESLTTSLRLDFNTTDPDEYGDGAQNVSFWISDMDRSAWDDFIVIQAYDINGDPVAVTFSNVGSNLSANAANGRVDTVSGGNVGVTDPAGAFQVTVEGPVATIVISYGNMLAGDQFVRISNVSYETIDPGFPWCFVRGTLIRTPQGYVPVENLRAGDVVLTADHGPQVLRWVGRSVVAPTPQNRPIRISAGALGDGLPSRDLLVSPAHRVVVSGWRAEVMFGCNRMLAHARDLVNDSTVRPVTDMQRIEYFHMLFDRHEIVWSNDTQSESFHPRDVTSGDIAHHTRDEILSLFPDLARGSGPDALPTLTRPEAGMLTRL